MSDLSNEVAIRMQEAHREETRWLRDEIKELRAIVSCLVVKAGGEVAISNRALHISIHEGAGFESVAEADNRRVLFRVRD